MVEDEAVMHEQAGGIPAGAKPSLVVRVHDGKIAA